MGRIELPPATPAGSIVITIAPGAPGIVDDSTVGERPYVPAEDYDILLEAATSMRRTLALAHAHLVGGQSEAALARIEADTGLDLADARAMSMIVGSLTGTSTRTDRTPT